MSSLLYESVGKVPAPIPEPPSMRKMLHCLFCNSAHYSSRGGVALFSNEKIHTELLGQGIRLLGLGKLKHINSYHIIFSDRVTFFASCVIQSQVRLLFRASYLYQWKVSLVNCHFLSVARFGLFPHGGANRKMFR